MFCTVTSIYVGGLVGREGWEKVLCLVMRKRTWNASSIRNLLKVLFTVFKYVLSAEKSILSEISFPSNNLRFVFKMRVIT